MMSMILCWSSAPRQCLPGGAGSLQIIGSSRYRSDDASFMPRLSQFVCVRGQKRRLSGSFRRQKKLFCRFNTSADWPPEGTRSRASLRSRPRNRSRPSSPRPSRRRRGAWWPDHDPARPHPESSNGFEPQDGRDVPGDAFEVRGPQRAGVHGPRRAMYRPRGLPLARGPSHRFPHPRGDHHRSRR